MVGTLMCFSSSITIFACLPTCLAWIILHLQNDILNVFCILVTLNALVDHMVDLIKLICIKTLLFCLSFACSMDQQSLSAASWNLFRPVFSGPTPSALYQDSQAIGKHNDSS